jgi:hypothetical protein
VDEEDGVEKLDPEDKVELPSSKQLTPLSIMVVDTISAVWSRTLLQVLFDSGSSSTFISKKCLPRHSKMRSIQSRHTINTCWHLHMTRNGGDVLTQIART